MGRLTAREYGRKARDIAQQARIIDPDVQLIACGSSNTIMPTYLTWDREVLEECYDMVDGISLHNYYGNEQELTGGKAERYLAHNLDMERQIQEITAVADYVQGLYRSPKRLWLSFDEWNVWYRARSAEHLDGKGAYAPKLLEEVYNLEDALLTGGFLNTLMRQSDRVRLACLAQIVNVIAPLVTNEKGILRQSIYFPYAMVLEYAHGRMLDIQVESETYPIRASGLRADFARNEEVPFIDVVATYDARSKRVAVFALNRDLSNERELALTFEDITPSNVLACDTITGTDLKAFNTFEKPDNVKTTKHEAGTAGGRMSVKLPPRSYTVLQLAV
jgi:alpha-N-arabinofuranosidase